MISIVVPVYNGEKYIVDCLKSILLQTYTEWELLIIDNASTDDSLDICKDYVAKDDRIQVLHQHHNMGVSAARNLGMQKARGEFITFIDVDDWVAEDYLEKLLAIQKKKNADMVVCEYQKAGDKDRTAIGSKLQKKVTLESTEVPINVKETEEYLGMKTYQSKEYLENYFLKGNTHCWGVLFKAEFLYGQCFPKGMTIGEDMLFLLDVAEKAVNIVVTNYKGYYYYINESGAMNKKFTRSYMDQITCWKKALQRVEEKYPELKIRVESILVVSVLLVVGKIAELGKEERLQYQKEEEECYETFVEYAKNKEIEKYLPAGYPLKVRLYRISPKLYISLYEKWKKK